MAEPARLRALLDAVRTINDGAAPKVTLDELVAVTRERVPGADHVGATVWLHDGRVDTVAHTDPRVVQLDGAQTELGEGPVLDVLHSGKILRAPDLELEARWSRWAPFAVGAGVSSFVGLPLFADDGARGTLHVYSASPGAVDQHGVQVAELFASHAAVALGRHLREEQLGRALSTRKVIGQAIGVLMERYGLDEDRAFGYVLRTSSHSNVKVRDVAAQLVGEVEEQATNDTPVV